MIHNRGVGVNRRPRLKVLLNERVSMETGGSLERRGRVLEDEFFHRVDQELMAKLQAQMAHDSAKESLASVCSWAPDVLLDQLVSAGVTAQTLVAMTLFPLVRTAWADRQMDEAERSAILRAATEHCAADSVAYKLLEGWTTAAPPDSLYDAWKEYTKAFCASLAPEARQELRERVMKQTREIAEAAGGFLGLGKISPKEESTIKEIEAVFCTQ